MSKYRALVDEWRVTLSTNTAALFALYDNPPQGLTGPELGELLVKRAAAVTTAARQLVHARHKWLSGKGASLYERLVDDPDFFDPKIAGWWVWGICSWIGNGWCSRDERLNRCLPKVGTPGHGIHAPTREAKSTVPVGKKPVTHRNKGVNVNTDVGELFEALCERLRYVRVCCGDWKRVMGRSTLGIDTEHGMTPCGVVLDKPYAHDKREKRLYREDHANLSKDVEKWALENGDNPKLRIALCGWEGEHAMPASWEKVEWRSNGTGKNRALERIWFSPYCSPALRQADLFANVGPSEAIEKTDDAFRASLRDMAAAFRGAS